jgi:hypothetical protein
VAEFLETRLQNFQPCVDVVPARKRNSAYSPDDASILIPLLHADMIFMGPGSPTYAVRNLMGTLTWNLVRARHRMGAALVFASAATIAIGARVLPVYEIYKVGDDISCPPGLDLFADFGLELSCIPHWNNADGGADLDTSRCFVGMERFARWCEMLPTDHTTLGLDEHTGIVVDFMSGNCTVSGVSSVTLLRQCNPEIYPAGSTFPVGELGRVHCPEQPRDGIPTEVWEMVENTMVDVEKAEMPDVIQRLAEQRQAARLHRDWAASDLLRKQMEILGWSVQDTPEGQKIVRQL